MSTDFSRTLSLLRQEKGLSQRMAAAALGITEKAVDNALQRTRSKLAKALNDYLSLQQSFYEIQCNITF